MNELDAKIIKKLPSMFWTRMIIDRKGGASLGKIHKELMPGYTSSWKNGSRRLYKNYRGIEVKDKRFIELVENDLPGTKRLLFHPLWDILRHPDASINDIFSYMNKLELNLIRKLFSIDPNTKMLKRKQLRLVSQIYYIGLENNLDALACLLMLIREAELNKKIQAYICCKWEAVHLIHRLSLCSPYTDVMPLLQFVIYQLFIEKNNPIPKSMLNKFLEDFPFDKSIPPFISLTIINDINSGILWNAEIRKIIESNNGDRLKLLFYADHFIHKSELKKALHQLSLGFDSAQSSAAFPAPLDKLINFLRGDSRKYLAGTGKLYF